MSLRNIILIYSIFSLSHTAVFSQRYDYNWIFGYDGEVADENWGNIQLNFTNGNPVATYIPEGRINLFNCNASMSSASGELLYYTNGYDLYDKYHRILPNALVHSPEYWPRLLLTQGAIFLPSPEDTNQIYLIYSNLEKHGTDFFVDSISYLVIDSKLNRIIKKDRIIKERTNVGFMSACRHANGRDWWMVFNVANTDRFLKYILEPTGLRLVEDWKSGFTIPDGVGAAIFSPDGKYLLFVEGYDFGQNGCAMFMCSFDRATAKIEFLHTNIFDAPGFEGISFSPNSKYIYFSDGSRMYQIDYMKERHLENLFFLDTIREHIDIGSNYFVHQSAPDGRIYICTIPPSHVLHKIDRPNKAGLECGMRTNGYRIKVYSRGIPNFPNYRLGPIDGSPSDSLGIDNIPVAEFRYDQDTMNYRSLDFTNLSWYEPEEFWWDWGDGSQPYYTTVWDTSIIHTYAKDGIYEVCLRAKNKNGESTKCKKINIGTTATKDEADNPLIDITLSPNPMREILIIQVNDYLPEKMIMNLYDLQGNKIITKRLYEGSNIINTESLSTGVYLVEIIERNRIVKSEKIVKN